MSSNGLLPPGPQARYYTIEHGKGKVTGKGVDDKAIVGADEGIQDETPCDANQQWSSDHITDPRMIMKYLDDYVIGQERAKKILAVAVFNHYNRVRANLNREKEKQTEDDAYPTSTPDVQGGRNSEHHCLDSPQGYYTANSAVQSANSNDVVSMDKPSANEPQRRTWINTPTTTRIADSTSNKTMSDQDSDIVYDKSNVLLIGPTGSGKTLLAKTLAQILQVPFSMSDATPFTQAGYVGDDVELVIQRLLQSCDYDVKRAEMGIIFIDEIDKISRRADSMSSSRDVSGEGVQQSLLRMLEGTVINVVDKSGGNGSPSRKGNLPGNGTLGNPPGVGGKGETYAVDTSNILFILSGAFIGLDKTIQNRLAKGSIGFNSILQASTGDTPETEDEKETTSLLHLVEPADLVKYGLIPEFIGRLPVLAALNTLSAHDLLRVLTEPKNSLTNQYKGLLKFSEVDLHFSKTALRRVAEIALEKKTGARGLRRIMENLLLEPMYETPGSNIRQIVIDSKVVANEKPPIYLGHNSKELIDKILAADDDVVDLDAGRGTVRRQMTQS
ncbi:hypothetical protein DFQ29_001684 [Apophysomyces sp. BC1021]|nr:hypothetical protein DFQ29_001684 [Apophysomyces sp. BC1021]